MVCWTWEVLFKIFTVTIFAFSSPSSARRITVIRTNPEKPLQKSGIAKFQIKSLSSFDQITMCTRFQAYQFDDEYKFYQTVITFRSDILFGSFISGDKCTFKDCSTYWKMVVALSSPSPAFLGPPDRNRTEFF